MKEVFLAQIIPFNATTNSEVHSPQLALLGSGKRLQLFPIYVQSTQRPRKGLLVSLFVVAVVVFFLRPASLRSPSCLKLPMFTKLA